jgi:hypothetical protein
MREGGCMGRRRKREKGRTGKEEEAREEGEEKREGGDKTRMVGGWRLMEWE